MTRSASVVLLVAVAAGYAAAIFLYRRAVPDGLTSPWFVLVAMIAVLGLAFVAQPVVRFRVPAAIRPVRRWEGPFYRRLGVPAFGTLLRRTPLRLLNTHVYLPEGAADAARVLGSLEAAEASHLLSALLTLPYIAYAGANGHGTAVAGILVAQLLVNLYPVAHLRLARQRVERVAARVLPCASRVP